jgi:hypothetical protein
MSASKPSGYKYVGKWLFYLDFKGVFRTMTFAINDLRAQLKFGGARPSYFQVIITNPVAPIADIQTPFLCRATKEPTWELGVIKLNYWGREVPYASTQKNQEWTCTIYNDEDWAIKHAMQQRSQAINSQEGNLTSLGANPNAYKSIAQVTHYSKDGDPLRIWQINGIWPSNIAGNDMDWSQGDQIMEFQVTFQMDSFQILSSDTGQIVG